MTLFESKGHPIGGYFELELPKAEIFHFPNTYKYQSVRGAFLALLRARRPKRVWLPEYICDAMLAPLLKDHTECNWYKLDNKLAVCGDVQLGEDDIFVYVNYFGLQNHNIANLLSRFPPQQIVLDFSHSFLEPPVETALATLYSPRKFFGLPDGGLLFTHLTGLAVPERDTESLARSAHLLKRLAGSPEDGYADFLNAEKTLAECEPKRMSVLTERILGGLDFSGIKKIRHENFMCLHRALGGDNLMQIDIAVAAAPLCYPFMTDDPTLRQHLISNRIFVPTYWTDALSRVGNEWAEKMVRNLLPLPIDQRYTCEDMQRIIAIIQRKEI